MLTTFHTILVKRYQLLFEMYNLFPFNHNLRLIDNPEYLRKGEPQHGQELLLGQ